MNLLCLLGHRWEYFCDRLKRKCKNGCGAEEWVFSKPYPMIGEAKYSWRDMSRKRFKF